MSTNTDDTPDAETLLQRLGQKLTGDDDGSESSESEAGQKEEPDADQKQPPDGGGDADEGEVTEDLIAALAEHMNVSPEEVRAAVDDLGQQADDMDDEDGDDDDDGEAEQEASGEVNIDFGAKANEHDLVDADTLEQKMDDLRESIVDDLGQKLADANEEAVEEIAQKMQTSTTDSPAGGSFQDAQDFESALDEVADKEGWV